MSKRQEHSVELYRSNAMKAAKDLYYGDEVIEELENAETEGEIQSIMSNARRKKLDCSNEPSLYFGDSKMPDSIVRAIKNWR